MEPGSGRGEEKCNNHKHSRSKNMLSLACTTYNRTQSLIHERLSHSVHFSGKKIHFVPFLTFEMTLLSIRI